ncbi:unnamed protein product [Amoebophrya sp. A120]|nr:unnamed protein product [Amoebophrya sp. A120]|eukprot:GSA120T00013936001.1
MRKTKLMLERMRSKGFNSKASSRCRTGSFAGVFFLKVCSIWMEGDPKRQPKSIVVARAQNRRIYFIEYNRYNLLFFTFHYTLYTSETKFLIFESWQKIRTRQCSFRIISSFLHQM